MDKQQEADWIDWAGGECPVAIGTTVQYRTKAGFVTGIFDVPEWHHRTTVWSHGAYEADPSTDIIAYRVVSA